MSVDVRLEWTRVLKGYDLVVRQGRPCTPDEFKHLGIPWVAERHEDAVLAGGRYIVERGGPRENYLLPGRGTAVFERFVNSPLTADGVLALFNEYGSLGLEGSILIKNKAGGAFNHIGVEAKRKHGHNVEADVLPKLRNLRRATEIVLAGDWGALESAVEADENWSERHGLQISYSRLGGGTLPRLFIAPRSLIQYAWIELLRAVSDGAKVRKCPHCNDYFVVAIEKGQRTTRKFCSDKCRVAAHREKKS